MSNTLPPHGLVALQTLLFMEFSRQEYWRGLPFPSPGDLPDSGIEPGSPAWQADALPSELLDTLSMRISRHLHCFFALPIVNSAATNIGVHVSFQIRISSRHMPWNGITGSYVNSTLSCLRTSIVTAPTYILGSVYLIFLSRDFDAKSSYCMLSCFSRVQLCATHGQ